MLITSPSGYQIISFKTRYTTIIESFVATKKLRKSIESLGIISVTYRLLIRLVMKGESLAATRGVQRESRKRERRRSA
jgi:CRISPR/Cas system Type II protein with McrA/HNH and RuvC-like nuclease domain